MRPFPSVRDHVHVSLARNKIEARLVHYRLGQTVRKVKTKMTQIRTLHIAGRKKAKASCYQQPAREQNSCAQGFSPCRTSCSFQDTQKETTANTPVLPARDHNEFRGPRASEHQTNLRSCYEALVRDTEIVDCLLASTITER